MKIALTTTGSTLDSPVDPRFGRAKAFVIYDTETDEYTTAGNDQNLNAAQGAGIQAAKNVAAHGVQAVVTGHVGPKAFSTLAAAGIAVYTGATGTIADAIEQFKQDRLQQADQADVQGHWV
ncbi:MAG: NifB/NifX family molybdenum-iron cluster-binding protein [Phycisphaerae bacterium]